MSRRRTTTAAKVLGCALLLACEGTPSDAGRDPGSWTGDGGVDDPRVGDPGVDDPDDPGTPDPDAPAMPDPDDPNMDPVEPVDGAVPLPLEIYLDDVVAISLPVGDPSGIDALYLRTHRLAYRAASTQLERISKGSVQLNDGDWVRLGPDVVRCFAHEDEYGCLEGGYHTLRLRVDLSHLGAVRSGENTLRFRFEGTDGFSMGYRVLDVDFLREGQRISGPSQYRHDDPSEWRAPRPDEVDEGRRLFAARVLIDSPLSDAPLRASCADCHAQDGRDLAYFNFSNESIVARSYFHGMSREDGERIASYIRSIDLGLPAGLDESDLGRPWNPPYQPGPGLDGRPVVQWAAGAGVDAVLERDEDMLAELFGEDAAPASMAATLGPDGDVNHRELPLAIQLPDWNDWLPEVHPLDIFGDDFESSAFRLSNVSPFGLYQEARGDLEAGRPDAGIDAIDRLAGRVHGTAGGNLKKGIIRVEYDGRAVAQDQDGTLIVRMSDGGTIDVDREAAGRGVRHWASVKQWELMNEFGLEELGNAMVGGELRGWATQSRNVFELAPHRAALSGPSFAHHSDLVGKYLSTAWYQLQVVISSGRGYARARLAPVDWNYQPAHVGDLASKVPGPAHPLRFAATIGEMVQVYANRGPRDNQWGFQQMHPVRFAPGTSQGRLFDVLRPEQRGRVLGAMLMGILELFERTPINAWPREGETSDENVPERSSYRPQTISGSLAGAHHDGRWADCWYTMVPLFREAGVSDAVLRRVIDFGAAMWPQGDWEALR